MNNLVISIAKTLLSKNIPFCIYRFPEESNFKLAISSDLVNDEKGTVLKFSPFKKSKENKEIILKVLPKERITDGFLEKMRKIPTCSDFWKPLSPQTSKEDYFMHIRAFLDALQKRDLKKAILSRVFYEKKSKAFNAIQCFLELYQNNPSAFVYLSNHPYSGMWLGASPELLLLKDGSLLQTIALAGTQSKKLTKDYHWRKKELEEHAMVKQHIEKEFIEIGGTVKAKKGPYTIETDSVAHLRTDYDFSLPEKVGLEEVLKVLHPTPAIAGLPVTNALNCIQKHERYNRKYYCGIVGEVEQDGNARLFVNLRCMQVGKDNIAIYVGGGITADSDPKEEWEETVLKGNTMKRCIDSTKVLH